MLIGQGRQSGGKLLEGLGMSEANAQELKDQGNSEFKKGNYLKAAAAYTKGIKLDPENAVFYR